MTNTSPPNSIDAERASFESARQAYLNSEPGSPEQKAAIAMMYPPKPAPPQLMPASPNHTILHDPLESTVICPDPADPQQRAVDAETALALTRKTLDIRAGELADAAESVDILTGQVLRLTNENADLKQRLADMTTVNHEQKDRIAELIDCVQGISKQCREIAQ